MPMTSLSHFHVYGFRSCEYARQPVSLMQCVQYTSAKVIVVISSFVKKAVHFT